MNQDRRKTILAAVRPLGVERLTNVLSPEFRLVFCHSLAAVQDQIRSDIDAIVCGTNFDESRMFELLQTLKSDIRYSAIPFVCVRVLDGVLHEATYASVRKACILMGASAFYDLAQARADMGKAEAAKAFRSMLHQLMNAHS
ncbi:hypothetical protein [Noviherbaspirillum saxi]|uniref:hypothetical protein n=1 Tax=Noviherbaspirillum saxi TaxID=2320863 RepID=UPI0011C3D293|nr:hypothetical protein [Noviherbaspirillum saxi]